MYKVLNERDACTRYKRSKIRRLSTQWGLETANNQITSSRDMNVEIGGCPLRAAKTRFSPGQNPLRKCVTRAIIISWKRNELKDVQNEVICAFHLLQDLDICGNERIWAIYGCNGCTFSVVVLALDYGTGKVWKGQQCSLLKNWLGQSRRGSSFIRHLDDAISNEMAVYFYYFPEGPVKVPGYWGS